MKGVFVFFVILFFVIIIFIGMNQIRDKGTRAVGMVAFEKEFRITYSNGKCSPEKLEIPFGNIAKLRVTADKTILFEIPEYYVKEAVSPKAPFEINFAPYGPGEYKYVCNKGASEGVIVVT